MLRSAKFKRNQKCPCGSGKKLKHCCLPEVKQVRAAVEAGKTQAEIMTNQIFNRTPMGKPKHE